MAHHRDTTAEVAQARGGSALEPPKRILLLQSRKLSHEQRGRLKGGCSQDWLPHGTISNAEMDSISLCGSPPANPATTSAGEAVARGDVRTLLPRPRSTP